MSFFMTETGSEGTRYICEPNTNESKLLFANDLLLIARFPWEYSNPILVTQVCRTASNPIQNI